MKEAYKNKTIRTIPEGAWEGGVINKSKNPPKKQTLNDITTDLQGNGYPVIRKKQDS